MKPITIHLTWLIVAAAAFAAGKFINPGTMEDSQSNPAGPVITSQAPSGQKNTADAPQPQDAASEVKKLVDEFRVSATGQINAGGMRDAVIAAVRENDPIKSSMMFAMLMEELTSENAESARKAISETVSGWESFRYLGLLNYKWGAIDGASAVASATEMGGRESMMSTAMVLSGWATNDPDAALEWMESQDTENSFGQGMWMRSLVTGLAGSDPNRATEMVAGLAQEDPRGAQTYT
ncbi:MAG: hypothetical protein P8J87_01950, partial [Verrucomicrobiales bacterium]|nr:hypothetical protein [Verrucomicrobiales bacterium]